MGVTSPSPDKGQCFRAILQRPQFIAKLFILQRILHQIHISRVAFTEQDSDRLRSHAILH